MQANKVILVGNLGRDPEARYMPAGCKEIERITNAAVKSRTPENILVSPSDVAKAGLESNGAAGADSGNGGSGSDDDDGSGDGDPDSDRRHSHQPKPPRSKRRTASRSAPSGEPQQHSGLQSSITSLPRSPQSSIHEKRSKRIHWMTFMLTLAFMGVAVWFAEKGYHPVAASAFAGAFAHCILALLKT